jgi:hypothetical protein
MLSLSWIKKNTMQRLIDDRPYKLMTSNPLIRMVESAKNMFGEVELEGYTVKTGVSFRHLLRHRNSASTSVVSTLKSVFLRVKTTLLSVKTTLLSVKTTLC